MFNSKKIKELQRELGKVRKECDELNWKLDALANHMGIISIVRSTKVITLKKD